MNSIKVKLSFIANFIAIFALIALGIISFFLPKLHYTKLPFKTKPTYLKLHKLPLKILDLKTLLLLKI